MGTTPLALLITIIATHITVIIPLLALPNCVAFSTSFSSTSTARWRNIHRSLRLTKLMELAHDRSSQHQQPPHMERLPLLARRDDDDSSSNSRSSSISSHSSKASTATTASLILGLAVPALVGEIIDPLLTLADTAFVGRFATITTAATTTAAQTSTESVAASLLAGLGSASAILSFSFYLFNFLCTATTPLISRKRAEAEQNATSTTTTSTTTTDEAALSVSGQALTLALLLGCVVTSLLVSFSQPLLYLMGTSQTGPDANQYATSFLTIRAFAAPAVFLNSASVGILRGFLDTKTSTIILLAANIINFTLDVLFIPVLHMVPTTGAAIATTTAEWIAALTFLGILAAKLPSAGNYLGSNQQQPTYYYYNNNISPLSDNNNNNNKDNNNNSPLVSLRIISPAMTIPNFQDVKPLLVASSSLFLRSVCLQLFISGAAAMAARDVTLATATTAATSAEFSSLVDTIANTATAASSGSSSSSVAAHQIALQLWVLCSFVCDALAAAAQALVADALGRDNMPFLRDLIQTLLSYASILGVALAILLQVGNISGFLLSFFTTDIATQKALSPLLNILILSQPLNAIVFTADGILQGASQFAYQAKGMLLSVATAIASFLALQLIIPAGQESTLIHVWQAFVILQIMRLLTSVVKLVQIIPI